MKTIKKLTALVIAVMLVMSMCFTSISVAAAETDTTSVLYLKPNSNWTMSNARFALYVYDNGGNSQWASMTAAQDGNYQVTVPEGAWTGYIFCRMNPANTTNSWSYKWNQTSDLTVPAGQNCYTVKDGTWDKGGGEWSLYTPAVTEPTTEATADTVATTVQPTTTVKYDYTVAGDAGLTGVVWDPSVNGMTDADGDGVYDITFSQVAAGSYTFKVTDGTWANSWGAADGGNYAITLNSACDVKISFNSTTKAISVTADGMGDFVLNYMAVVGNGTTGSAWMNGELWNTSTEANKMTDMGNGLWSITFNNVAAATDYQCKFIANNSYTYNWTSDGNFDGQINPTIGVPTDGSTVTLTIDVSGYDFAKKTGSVKTNVAVVPPVDPTGSTQATEASTEATVAPTEATEVPAKDYYLFGYINGANYACEEDYANIGTYKFVDGKLVATFTEDSYVGVKTSDNASWYMTKGWAGDVKSTTLYNTNTLDSSANKLLVPGGVELTFSLVVNNDDTLTLSYVAAEQPTTVEPTEAPTTVEPTVAPTTAEPTVAPTTVEPTTQPTTSADAEYSTYYLRGNIYLALAKTSTANVVSGTVQLTANTFRFDVTDAVTGIHYGRNSKYTDSINNAMFGASWGYCTFTTTGGTYTFTYNTKTNKLTVTCDSSSSSNFSNYRVRGSFNFALNTTANTGIVKNTIALPAGTFKFNVTDDKLIYGRMAEYTDSIGRALFGSSWGYCTLTISEAGLYEFTYDTATNQLTVLPKTTADSSYSIIGTNIGAVLKTTETANEVTTTVTLDAGAYKFKVANMDTATYYGRGASYTDTMSSAMFGLGWDWCTFNATGGTYTFTYNTKTNKMTVVKAA